MFKNICDFLSATLVWVAMILAIVGFVICVKNKDKDMVVAAQSLPEGAIKLDAQVIYSIDDNIFSFPAKDIEKTLPAFRKVRPDKRIISICPQIHYLDGRYHDRSYFVITETVKSVE